MRHNDKRKKGSILILALWVLTFLGVLALQIGLTLRQRIALLERLEARSDLRNGAEGAALKAIAALQKSFTRSQNNYTTSEKMYRHNNDELFKDIRIGRTSAEVSYWTDTESVVPQKYYGMEDEEGKMNINSADFSSLERLMERAVASDKQEAELLAAYLLDWREHGRVRAEGFYSDEYYSNLEYPYTPKNAQFEMLDELMLVKGFDQRTFNALLPFITVYGDGLVNINTVSKEVLMAIGLEDHVADKVLFVRRGQDGIDGTADDYMFGKTFDIASEIKNFIKLDLWEIKEIDHLNRAGKIKTGSVYYRIQSEAHLAGRDQKMEIFCIFNAAKNKVEYWKEKY